MKDHNQNEKYSDSINKKELPRPRMHCLNTMLCGANSRNIKLMNNARKLDTGSSQPLLFGIIGLKMTMETEIDRLSYND